MLNIMPPSQQETEAILHTSHGHDAHCVHIEMQAGFLLSVLLCLLLCVTMKGSRGRR